MLLGNDDNSKLMSEVVNTSELCSGLSSSKFVAIKLTTDSVGYKQFIEICKISLVICEILFFYVTILNCLH